MKALKNIFALVVMQCLLLGCSENSSDSPVEQSASFEGTHVFKVFVGDTFNNPLSKQSLGDVLYSSSNPEVADVDAMGNVSVLSPGVATISAKVERDSQYLSAEASFDLSAINREYKIHAWVGENGSGLYLPASHEPMDLYLSREENCDLENYAACSNSDLIKTSTDRAVHNVSALTKSTSASLSLVYADHKAESLISPTILLPKNYPTITSFNGKLWMLGGDGGLDSDQTAIVWSSIDGINWVNEAEEGHFKYRREHSLTAFADKLWVVGGIRGPSTRNDVWSTTDGRIWERQVESAQFPQRGYHQLVAHDNKMWILGGKYSGTVYSDIWSSQNGIEWELIKEVAEFGERYDHQVVQKDGEYWMIGGADASHVYNDVWKSSDLKTWQRVVKEAPWSPRRGHQVSVYQGKFVLTSGENLDGSEYKSDTWQSSDGIEWQLVSDQSVFGTTSRHQTLVFKDELYLFPGNLAQFDSNNGEVWRTNNIKDWELLTNYSEFDYRANHRVISVGGKLLLLGGESLANLQPRAQYFNDVWSSSNGVSWEKETDNAAFAGRASFEIIRFADTFWLYGGKGVNQSGQAVEYHDVWKSTDGINWQQESSDNLFTACNGTNILQLGGKLWMISAANASCESQLWSSADGVNWVNSKEGLALPQLNNKKFVSFDQKIWAIGAYNGQADVWEFDGVNPWKIAVDQVECETDINCFDRQHHYLVQHNDQLFVIGGQNRTINGIDRLSNVLVSDDALSWRILSSQEYDYFSLEGDVISHAGKIFQVGGRIGPVYNNKGSLGSLVWSSDNGAEWRKGYQHTLRFEQ